MFQKYLTQNVQALPGSSTGIVLDGCLIQSVQRGSPASFSETPLVGQSITHVDKKAVDANTLPDLLKGNDIAGGTVTLKLADGQDVTLIRESVAAMKARAAVYEEISEDEKGKKLLGLIQPFLKCDPWRQAPDITKEGGGGEGGREASNELPPSRSLQDLQSQLDKANQKLSQYEMLQQRIAALETQLKDARSTLAHKAPPTKAGAVPELEHLRRCNKALQTTLDSLLTVGESVTVSSPVIAQAHDMPLSPQKVKFALSLPSESGIHVVEHDATTHKCDYCEMNDHIIGKWKALRRAFLQQQVDHAAEIEEATRSLLRLRECLVKMQPRADTTDDSDSHAAPRHASPTAPRHASPSAPRSDRLGAQV